MTKKVKSGITKQYEMALGLWEIMDLKKIDDNDREFIFEMAGDSHDMISDSIRKMLKDLNIEAYSFNNISFQECDGTNPHHTCAYYTFDLTVTEEDHLKVRKEMGIEDDE